jgi:hypothetical protein
MFLRAEVTLEDTHKAIQQLLLGSIITNAVHNAHSPRRHLLQYMENGLSE